MTIKAVLRQGVIQPIEPLPPGWEDGQELLVEEPASEDLAQDLGQWAQEMEAAASELPTEDHDRFQEALKQIEKESKEAVRKQWGSQ